MFVFRQVVVLLTVNLIIFNTIQYTFIINLIIIY